MTTYRMLEITLIQDDMVKMVHTFEKKMIHILLCCAQDCPGDLLSRVVSCIVRIPDIIVSIVTHTGVLLDHSLHGGTCDGNCGLCLTY